MKKILKYLITYLPDIFLLIGAGFLSYNIFIPTNKTELLILKKYFEYNREYKTLGIILIILATDIIIRRFLNNNKTNI